MIICFGKYYLSGPDVAIAMLKIEKLKDHPDLIPTLATLWKATLGQQWLPDITLEEITAWYHEWLNDELPLAYVAFEDEVLVASFSLQWDDGVRPDLFPWVGDLVVAPEHQNRGLGKQLFQFACERVKEMGFNTCYCFTLDAGLIPYYARFGCEVVAEDVYENKPVYIMALDLS